jgi:hypothetical protein
MPDVIRDARQASTLGQHLFSSDAFGEHLCTLQAKASRRGDLISFLRGLYRDDALHVECWRDLARVLDRVNASPERIREARKLWNKFAVSPGINRRTRR